MGRTIVQLKNKWKIKLDIQSKSNFNSLIYGVIFLYLVLPKTTTFAAQWEIEPSIYFAGTYIDNVFLTPSDTEISDYVGQVNPGIDIEMNSQRSNLDLAYEMQNIFYSDLSEFDDTYHYLNTRGDVQLLPDLFFVEATLGHTQQPISRDAGIPVDNITLSANRTNLDLASVSPFFRTQFGRSLVGELRYRKAWLNYDAVELSDSEEQQVIALLDSPPTSGRRLLWSLIYDYRLIEPETNLDSRLERSNLEIDYSLTRQLGILAGGGYEHNEYDEINATRVEDGPVWYIGFRWSASHANTLTCRIGERFFGRTANIEFLRTSRRWTLGASYDEEFRTATDILLNNQELGDVTDPILRPGDPLPSSDVFLEKRTELTATRDYSKTILDITLYYRDRENQQTGEDELIYGGELGIDWQFLPRTKLEMNFTAEHYTFPEGVREDNIQIVNMLIEHSLTRDITTGLGYQQNRRDSTNISSEYTQNQLTVNFEIIF